jgi:pyrimidine-nucleoside phosphorylase
MKIHPLDVILHKRDGLTLSDAEIQAFVRAVVDRTPEKQLVTDAQIAAFLMAVFQRGLNPQELASLTKAMRFSGEVFDARPLGTFTIDKHSTGGVGDKTSLLIASILAAAGLAHPTPAGVPGICVPMISGRSLGHTGGTLDKLETIPGFDTQLSLTRFEEVLRHCGACLIGQTPTLVPADRILYALRDHTGTVESPYLITASIMSKKLAESLNALVLDVKTGSGAFMRREEDARLLANLMVQTGEASGTRTVALLTRMDEPLGRYAGNWLEVLECVDILRTSDPARRHPLSSDLIELTNILSGWMLHLAGQTETPEAGAELSDSILASGAAYQAWLRLVEAQGGDTGTFTHPERFHKPAASRILTAESSGFLASMDCTQVGWAVQRLGAGRAKPGDPVSAHAGLEVHAKIGHAVTAGQPLVTLFTEDESLLAEPYEMVRATYCIAPAPPPRRPLIQEVIHN